ncbi:uncharacterized protein [Zea mays]|uniref:RNA-binding (RRM/RBD/RNP motifs) family protein n=2 Tax=Zea mays TaxID=4577 RepID=K7VDH6_MAIZE|nr:uncharacterized protein LOC100273471 isoform X1 [Zea mays]AQL03806.1 RNA-binding (RRM/RBD/RNP motifs) family protein [Zea mays]AQL03808.1 RNA-binding (RRM/RBD/RNP motifs) family protein [Zea mays]|eukprot:XP_008658258.1 uncharacterized protein LOC100273471 isoform X1 [Zea mays]
MAGYGEENQNAMNGYEEEEEEEEVEEVEEVYEEEEEGDGEGEGDEGAAAEAAAMAAETRSVDGGRGLAEAVGNVDAGGEDERDADSSGGDASGKVFVGGVAWETTEETFTKHFQKYGAITDSVIMKDKHTRMPRGFGFVTFSDPSVLDRVLEDEHVIDGRTVEVKRTVPKELSSKDGPKTKKIFVGGIPPSLTEDKLKEHFSSYGKVVEHQIMLDHSTGRSRGFGFVTFESEDAVERVMSEGRMHDLGGKQVEIKKAEPKKPGAGDSSSNGRHSRGGGHRDSYRGSGVSVNSGGGYGYGGGYRSAAAAYYGSTAYGAYGRGYGYGATSGYGSGYGSAYGGSMYGGPYGAYGSYGGAYGGGAYGAPGGYGGGGYGSYGGAGGMGGGGSAGGRGSSRYHPYGK